MRIPRIFVDQVLTSGAELTLEAGASNHVLRVMRLKPGAELIVFNGQKGEFAAELTAVQRNHAIVMLRDFVEKSIESPIKIHLLQGISKGDRMDYVMQKAVELGVYQITPVLTERCNVKLSSERMHKKLQHWQQIVISACEQCGRDYIPQVLIPVALEKALPEQIGTKLVLAHRADNTLTGIEEPVENITILIGPEGGLTDAEVDLAQQSEFMPIKLGPRILRTETAALAAITAIQTKWGDL